MHSPPVPAHVFPLHWEKCLGSFSFFCCFPFPFFIHISYFIIALYLILSVLVAVFFSVTNTKVHFAIFTRQLFIYVSAQLDCIGFFHSAPHWKQIHMQCSVEPCTVTHKLLVVWVALHSLYIRTEPVHLTTFTRVWSNRSNIFKH